MRPFAASAFVAILASAVTACTSSEAPDVDRDDRAATVAAQIEVMDRRIAATNVKDWSTWQALHTDDACRTAPELAEPLCGSAAMRGAIEALSNAFPDYRLELEQAVGDGEWLTVRMRTRGTMTGPLVLSDGGTIPPTGRSISQEWVAVVAYDRDRIVQFDEFYDQYTLMVQLGLAPPL